MADIKTKDDEYYQSYLPPPHVEKWEAFKEFVWNPERREFLGRSGTAWFKVSVFYTIFSLCLAAFLALLLIIFYQTLDYYQPKLYLQSSSIGSNPGLGFRPMPDKTVESTLIWFKRNSEAHYIKWVKSLDSFLEPYDYGQQYGNTFKECKYGDPITDTKVCDFRIDQLGPNCTREKKFGYDQSSPCVVIKMNKIWGWRPDPYTPEDYHSGNLPHDMPFQIRQRIKDYGSQTKVWVSCEGENPADKENIGELTYWPHEGFDTYFYPYVNTPGYLAPLVMIQFQSLVPGILVNVECKAWAKNIKHDRMERAGSVHFEFLMD